MANIAIVGAGLVGRLLALLLAKQPSSVVERISLFEQHTLSSDKSIGRIAAAMVAPIAESVSASEHIVSMGQQSLTLWPQLLSFLELNNLWWQQGSIVVAHPQDKTTLQHFVQRLKQQEKGDVNAISAVQLAQLAPELASKFQEGLHLPLEGHINNEQLYIDSAKQIKDSRIQLVEQCTVNINDNTIYCSGETTDYDWVIDCRGMGAKEQMLANSQLRGVRGEVIRVRAPQVNLLQPVRIMHPRYPLYIVPKADHQYVIGATEIESDNEDGVTVRSALELLSAAYSVHTGFAEAEIIAVQTGLRPTLLDNEPLISVQNKVIQVNGLYRHGYLLAPYVLEQLLLLMSSHFIPKSRLTNNLSKILLISLP